MKITISEGTNARNNQHNTVSFYINTVHKNSVVVLPKKFAHDQSRESSFLQKKLSQPNCT